MTYPDVEFDIFVLYCLDIEPYSRDRRDALIEL